VFIRVNSWFLFNFPFSLIRSSVVPNSGFPFARFSFILDDYLMAKFAVIGV